MPIKLILALIVSYLVGSVPTGYIFTRLMKGVDIRQHGSGNIGATNVFRVLGKGPGSLVLIIDIIKGALATTLIPDCFGLTGDLVRVFVGLCAVIGHNWTVFLNFKGGRGVATSIGVLIGLAIKVAGLRIVLVLTVASWAIVFLTSGFVSLSSIVASVLLPVFMLLFAEPVEFVILGVVFCFFIVWRHRPNIKRLLTASESRIEFSFLKRKRFLV